VSKRNPKKAIPFIFQDDVGLLKTLADATTDYYHFARDEGGGLYYFSDGVYRPKGRNS
jgi:hypothetical protein